MRTLLIILCCLALATVGTVVAKNKSPVATPENSKMMEDQTGQRNIIHMEPFAKRPFSSTSAL